MPVTDFSAVTWATVSPNILVVHPSLAVKSVAELVAVAKAKPGELNYGTGSAGSTPHLAAALFKSMAGVNIVRVPYKGSAPALTALIGGQLQFMFPSTSSVAPMELSPLGLKAPLVEGRRAKLCRARHV